METYTPTPTQLIDVSLPQAGVDPVGVSTVRVGMEAAADGIAWLNQKTAQQEEATQNRTICSALTVSGTTLTPGDFLDYSGIPGEVGSASLIVLTGIGAGGRGLRLGSGATPGAAGWWRIGIRGTFTLDTTDDSPDMPLFVLWRHDGFDDPADGAAVAALRGMKRGNTSPTSQTMVDDSVLIRIEGDFTVDPQPRFSVQWNGSYDLEFVNDAIVKNYFFVEQIWKEVVTP